MNCSSSTKLVKLLDKFSNTQELNSFLQEIIETQRYHSWCPKAAVILQSWAEKVSQDGDVLCALSIAKLLLKYLDIIHCDELICIIPIYLQLNNLVDLTAEWESEDIFLHISFWEAVNNLLMGLYRKKPDCLQENMLAILSSLFSTSINETSALFLRQTRLKALNFLLENCSEDVKELFRNIHKNSIYELVDALKEVGDYDFQSSLIEAVFRLTATKERLKNVSRWFHSFHYSLHHCFSSIKDFDPDCRKFLNAYNSCLGEKKNVFTFICSRAKLGHFSLQKPKVPSYEHLWVDFNMGSSSISLLFDRSSPDLLSPERIWETIIVYSHEVDKAILVSSIHSHSLVLTLNNDPLDFFASPPSQDVMNLISKEFSLEFDEVQDNLEKLCCSLFNNKFEILTLENMGTSRKITSRKVSQASSSKKTSGSNYFLRAKTDDNAILEDQPSPSLNPHGGKYEHIHKEKETISSNKASHSSVSISYNIDNGKTQQPESQHSFVTSDDEYNDSKGNSEEIIPASYLKGTFSSSEPLGKDNQIGISFIESNNLNLQNAITPLPNSQSSNQATPVTKRSLKNMNSTSSTSNIFPVTNINRSSNVGSSNLFENQSKLKILLSSSHKIDPLKSKKKSSPMLKINVEEIRDSLHANDSEIDNDEYIPTVVHKTQENDILEIDSEDDIIPPSYPKNIYATPVRNQNHQLLFGFSGKAPSTKSTLSSLVHGTDEFVSPKQPSKHCAKTIVKETEEIDLEEIEVLDNCALHELEKRDIMEEKKECKILGNIGKPENLGSVQIMSNSSEDCFVNVTEDSIAQDNVTEKLPVIDGVKDVNHYDEIVGDCKQVKENNNGTSSLGVDKDQCLEKGAAISKTPQQLNVKCITESTLGPPLSSVDYNDIQDVEESNIKEKECSILLDDNCSAMPQDSSDPTSCIHITVLDEKYSAKKKVGEISCLNTLSPNLKNDSSNIDSNIKNISSNFSEFRCPIHVIKRVKNKAMLCAVTVPEPKYWVQELNAGFTTDMESREVTVPSKFTETTSKSRIEKGVLGFNVIKSDANESTMLSPSKLLSNCSVSFDGLKTPMKALKKMSTMISAEIETSDNSRCSFLEDSSKDIVINNTSGTMKSISGRKKKRKSKIVPPHYDINVTPDYKARNDKVHSKKKLFDTHQQTMLEESPPVDYQELLNIDLQDSPLIKKNIPQQETRTISKSYNEIQDCFQEIEPSPQKSQHSSSKKFFIAKGKSGFEDESISQITAKRKRGRRKTIYSQNNCTTAFRVSSPFRSPTAVYDLIESPGKWLTKKESPKRKSLRTYKGKRGRPCYKDCATDSDSEWAPHSKKKSRASNKKNPERPYTVEDSDSLDGSLLFKSLKPKKSNISAKPEKVFYTRSTAKKQKQQNKCSNKVSPLLDQGKRSYTYISKSPHSSPEVQRNTSLNQQNSFEEIIDVPNISFCATEKTKLNYLSELNNSKSSKRLKLSDDVSQMKTMLQTILLPGINRQISNNGNLAITGKNDPMFPPDPPNNTPDFHEIEKTIGCSQSFEITGPKQSSFNERTSLCQTGPRFSYVPELENSYSLSILKNSGKPSSESARSPYFTDGLDTNLNFETSKSSPEYIYFQAESEIPSRPNSDFSSSDEATSISKLQGHTYSAGKYPAKLLSVSQNRGHTDPITPSIKLNVGNSYKNEIEVHSVRSSGSLGSIIRKPFQGDSINSQESELSMEIPSLLQLDSQIEFPPQQLASYSNEIKKHTENRTSTANKNSQKKSDCEDFAAALSSLLNNKIITPVNKYSTDSLETPANLVPKKLDYKNALDSSNASLVESLGLSYTEPSEGCILVPTGTLRNLTQLISQIDNHAREVSKRSSLANKLISAIAAEGSRPVNSSIVDQ